MALSIAKSKASDSRNCC